MSYQVSNAANSEVSTAPVQLSSVMKINDIKDAVMCRISNKFRMKFNMTPGLYALGNPGKDSPVLVTANYKLSVNTLRKAMKNRNAWILVIDTKGINVWCAAGKGTFCTKAIMQQITVCKLDTIVSHRVLILPQLGASGVNANKLHKESGFTVRFGPVRAADLPRYIDDNYKATPEMRRVKFPITDRAILIPMEVLPALQKLTLFLLVAAVLFGLTRTGIMYKNALLGVSPFVIAGVTAVMAGSVLTPLLLPYIPFRAFSLKGFCIGLIGAIFLCVLPFSQNDLFLSLLFMIGVPAFSSYNAFLFTGSTTYTSPSGVKKELRIALPLYLSGIAISGILFTLILIRSWGII